MTHPAETGCPDDPWESSRPGSAAWRQVLSTRTFTWIGLFLVAGLFLSLADRFAVLNPVEDIVLTAASPVQEAMTDAVRPLADVVTDYSGRQQLAGENARLRLEIERLHSEVARLRESEIRAQSLEELLAVRDAFPDQSFVTAAVVARDPSNLKEVVAIDRGSADGVREGMVVLGQGRSLVGRVTSVTSDHAWVTLVNDPSSSISAMIQESRAAGVVSGTHDGETLVMEYVRQGLAVHEGDTVITSAEGGTVPPGVVIGLVSEVKVQGQELFQTVRVQPLASLGRLETVLIMTSFAPRALEEAGAGGG